MKRFIAITALFFLCACMKSQRVSARISGSWTLISYKRTNYEGMISYPIASGVATFNALGNTQDSSTYSFEIARIFGATTDSLLEKGTYKLVEKGGFMYLNEQDSIDNTISYIKYRILSLTKTDLEIEFSKGTDTDILLFEKQ
jgi:hypothetical protein